MSDPTVPLWAGTFKRVTAHMDLMNIFHPLISFSKEITMYIISYEGGIFPIGFPDLTCWFVYHELFCEASSNIFYIVQIQKTHHNVEMEIFVWIIHRDE